MSVIISRDKISTPLTPFHYTGTDVPIIHGPGPELGSPHRGLGELVWDDERSSFDPRVRILPEPNHGPRVVWDSFGTSDY